MYELRDIGELVVYTRQKCHLCCVIMLEISVLTKNAASL